MTFFDIIVPVTALSLAGVGILIVRATHKSDNSKSHSAE